jgi:hypothetical protein
MHPYQLHREGGIVMNFLARLLVGLVFAVVSIPGIALRADDASLLQARFIDFTASAVGTPSIGEHLVLCSTGVKAPVQAGDLVR